MTATIITGIDTAKLNQVEEILGEHRIANPRVEGDWLVWDLMRDERTVAKRFDRLKRVHRASFMRRGRVGVHVDELAA